MHLYSTTVAALPQIPSPEYPPAALGYVACLHSCIGSTDTIIVSPSFGVPALHGMILLTSFSKEQVVLDDIPSHPFIQNKELQSPPCYFKLQLYITKKDAPSSIVEEWPHLNPDLPDTIPPASPSNCAIWIHSSQVDGLAFFPHTHHCVNQTQGNLSCRHDMYSVDHTVMVFSSTSGMYQCSFEALAHDGYDAYNMFGHHNPHHITSYTSFTERVHESMCHLSRSSSLMLIKTGKVNQRVYHKQYFPWEAFKYIYRCLQIASESVLKFSKTKSKARCRISTDNMTLSIGKADTVKWIVRAEDIDGFKAMRTVMSNVGYGVKKRHPTLSALYATDGSNCLTVQEQDTIHLVDIDAQSVLYRVGCDDDSFSSEPIHSSSNFVRLSYDYLTKQVSVGIKCYTTVVSLLSTESRHYLHRNNIVSGAVYVLFESRIWKVVRSLNGQTILCAPNDEGDTVVVSDDYARDNAISS